MNDKSIWEYDLTGTSEVTFSQSIGMELESARLFVGLSGSEFESLSGDTQYATEDSAIGVYESKSDVLIYYRSQKLIEAIVQTLNF